MRPEVNTRISTTADTLVAENKKAQMKKEEENVNINFSSQKTNSADYDVNTKDNLFLKEYIMGKAEAEGIKVPEGMKINISNFNSSEARDIYSGNPLKGIAGIQTEQYYNEAPRRTAEFFDRHILGLFGQDCLFKHDLNFKNVEQYCDERNLTDKQKEQVLDLYRFHDVRVNIFKARIKDMFNFFTQDKEIVARKIANMKITPEQKEEMIKVKDFVDKYFKVEAEYNGKTYNLLNLTDEDKTELNEKSPEFLKFIEKMQPELKKNALYFAQKEVQGDELSDAGATSRWTAWGLMGLLGYGLYDGYKSGKEMKEGMKAAEKFAEFIRNNPKEGNEILDKCVAKFNKLNKNGQVYVAEDTGELKTGISKLWAKMLSKIKGKPAQLNKVEGTLAGTKLIERYMKKIGFEGGEYLVYQKAINSQGLKKWVNPITKFKNAKGRALGVLLGATFLLSGDDCAGAIKDFFQDQNNFGTGAAMTFAGISALGGVASSAAFVPTFQGVVDWIRSQKMLTKMGIIEKEPMVNKMFSKKTLNILSKIPLAKRLAVPTLLGGLGVVLASTSSGSSWTSMGLTRWLIGKNGDDLEKKNIIDKKDNTFTSANENMMEYEAYLGKYNGITGIPLNTSITGDWTIGSTLGVAGLFTHVDPRIERLFTSLQGCSETLTASGYQIAGNTMRDAELNKQKQELVESAKNKIKK